jgi:DNA polymerase I-like protein with 3'-5' exonuclease and polymerase domains
MPALIRMMARGIRVNLDLAAQARDKVLGQAQDAQDKLDALIGKKVNVNSSPQIRALFNPKMSRGRWVADNGVVLQATGAGAPSIDSNALRAMENDHRAALVLEVRSLIKTADTFLAKHIIESSVNGRVYPSINQVRGETAGTVTGRLSYNAPAMQQIPSRNKAIASVVKPCFLPDDGHLWLDSDLNSNEVRVFGHLVNDEKINAAYRADITTDFHGFVGKLTGLPRNASYPGEPNAKTLNLSMIFCKGNGGIAETLGLPYTWETFTTDEGEVVKYRKAGSEAMAIIDNYHNELPGVRALSTRASKVAGLRGYVKTKWGRRLRFPDKRFLYKASGLLIQASAADVNKVIIRELDRVLPEYGGHLILNTHDSYSISVPEDEWRGAAEAAKSIVAEEFKWMNVPLLLEISGTGPNWWEAVK